MSVTLADPRVLELLRFTESHNRHTESLAQATGERFNIFQILRVGHLEVTTHSPILAEMLNPKGVHGQGGAFLRLFLERFGIEGFDVDSTIASLEYYAGPLTDESGGRLDILVKDNAGATILIENKIYADDQDNQMARYRDFDQSAHLFYLTLDGREPENIPKEQIAGVQCISYSTDILGWLKDCRKEAVCSHTVRETITQYIRLVEELTHQSTTLRMNKDLIEAIIRDAESFKAFDTLRNAEAAVHDALFERLDLDLNAVANSVGAIRIGQIREMRKKWGGFSFTTPELRQNNLQISFEFDGNNYARMYFGFGLIDHSSETPLAKKLTVEFDKEFQAAAPSFEWPAWAWWKEYHNWWSDSFEAVRAGRFAQDVQEKLKVLMAVGKRACSTKTAISKT